MIPDPLLFTFALISTGALSFLLVYYVSILAIKPIFQSHSHQIELFLSSHQTITLSDLECDYLNAQQCCANLNFWVIPKLVTHAFLTIAILVTGHYWLFLFNAPMLIWTGYELYSLPSGNMGIYDPTEIHNRGMIKKHMRQAMIYLGYFFIFFFVYLYW